MFQNQNILLEENDLTEETIEHDFMKDLINYISIVERTLPTNTKEIVSICKRLYKRYTQPFYEKWSCLNLVEWHSEYEKKFYSFILNYCGTKMLFPHRMIVFKALQPKNTIFNELKKCMDLKSFFFTLNKVVRELNLPLLSNDLKIIETYLNPLIRYKIATIPTNRQMASLIHCSENTVSRRMERLSNKGIITHKYRIDMAQLGYHTSAIIHLDHFDDILPSVEPYCLADVPIDWGKKIGKIKILQVPYSRKRLLRKIKNYFDPLFEVTLTKSYIGWNLSSLTPEVKQRWQILPPIFLGDKWTDSFLTEGPGVEYNMFNDMTTLKISETQAKMLDLLQTEASPKRHLSQTLGVTQKYIQQYYEEFLTRRLIIRFTHIGNVGLRSKVWITILGSRINSGFDLLTNIVEHLKFFPFSYLFYNDNDLDKNGKTLLAGIVWIPPSWFSDFNGAWIRLVDLGFVPKININLGVIKWGINIHNTYDFESRNIA